MAQPQQITMRSAWVVTQEGSRHSTEVIGIISARKSAKAVKEYVEWLYALLNGYPENHMEFARYSKSLALCSAQFWTTNLGVPVESAMTCGHNPWLAACLASNIVLFEADDEIPLLEWTHPHRLVQDKRTLQIVEKIPGPRLRAPVHL
ncbi:MAG: hypothetical protein WCF79_11045, partial [Rhodomicrobium sp.]